MLLIISIQDHSPTPEVPEVKMSPDKPESPRQGLTMPMPDPGPHPAWYGAAVLLFFAGIILGTLVTQQSVVSPPGERVVIPGSGEITIAEPGRYVLWHEYKGEIAGESFHVDAKLPEWTLALRELSETGEPGAKISMEPTVHARENVRGVIRTTLGQYRLEPGKYQLGAEGDFPPRILHLRESQALRYGLGMFLGFGISLLGGIGGPALAIFIYYKRRDNFRRRYNPVVESVGEVSTTGSGSS